MDIVVINGSSCVGKTTVLHHILHKLPAHSAILDGDDVARLHPFQLTTTWLNLVQDNLLACAENMRAAGVNYLLLSFVFPSQERVDRMERIFGQQGFSLRWIHLVADERALRDRLDDRGVRQPDIIESALQLNANIAHLAESSGQQLVDTTDMTAEAVCGQILDALTEQICRQHPEASIAAQHKPATSVS